MLRSALRFRLQNTSYRSLRFNFGGALPEAYAAYLPVILLLLLPSLLLALVNPSDDELTDDDKQKLAGVLAHEIGHVEQRYSLRALAATSLSGVLSWALIGDFSAVATGAPVLMTRLHFSRAMENEADAYAIEVLRTNGIATKGMADLFARPDQDGKNNQGELKAWMRSARNYLSIHPSTEERIARLRAGGESP